MRIKWREFNPDRAAKNLIVRWRGLDEWQRLRPTLNNLDIPRRDRQDDDDAWFGFGEDL